MSPKPTHTYQGNPGYVHALKSGVVTLYPGDPVVLEDDEVTGDFAPIESSKPKSKPALVATDPEGDKP